MQGLHSGSHYTAYSGSMSFGLAGNIDSSSHNCGHFHGVAKEKQGILNVRAAVKIIFLLQVTVPQRTPQAICFHATRQFEGRLNVGEVARTSCKATASLHTRACSIGAGAIANLLCHHQRHCNTLFPCSSRGPISSSIFALGGGRQNSVGPCPNNYTCYGTGLSLCIRCAQ